MNRKDGDHRLSSIDLKMICTVILHSMLRVVPASAEESNEPCLSTAYVPWRSPRETFEV